jgi:hypothetical protein
METFKKEVIEILKEQIKKTDDSNFGNFLQNQIECYHHSYLFSIGFFGNTSPKINKLPVEGGLQAQIDYLKKLQFIYLYNYKYNENISTETVEWLDMKVGKIYEKIGKKIDSLYKKKQQKRKHWENKYGNLTIN